MDSNTLLKVNIIVWSECRSDAAKLAAEITGGSESPSNTWSGVHEGVSVSAFIRCQNESITASPAGITDVLVLYVAGDGHDAAKSYVGARKGIPFKYVTSSQDLSAWAQENEVEFIPHSDLKSNIKRIVDSSRNLDTTLRSAFEKLDLNKNGFITADELVQASSGLGHEINSEDAKRIATTLSEDGNVPFDQFKKWWIMGRGDFNLFRKVVELEMSVGNLVKKGSKAFNDFLDAATNSHDSGYVGKMDIGAVKNFGQGLGFSMDLAGGKDAEEILNFFPDYYKSSPMVYALEIHTNDENTGALLVQVLQGFSGMLSMIPQVAQFLNAGLSLNFRHVGKSVFIDVSLGGMIGDQIIGQYSHFNFSNVNFSGRGSMVIFSELKPTDLLTNTIDELLAKLLNFKLQSQSEFSNVKLLANALYAGYMGVSSNNLHVAQFVGLIKLLGTIKEFGYEFKYDSDELASLIKEEFIPHGALMMATEKLQGLQAIVQMSLEQFKPMIDSVLEPYKAPLAGIDFDRIGISSSVGVMKMFYKTTLHLPGLTQFVRENFLSENL
jgi:hypothetical protein